MTTRAALCLLLVSSFSCKSVKETSTTTPGPAGTSGSGEEPAGAVTPQEPDPSQLAQAVRDFRLGNLGAVKQATEALLPDLSGPSRARANGLASALLALAAAEELAESAKEPAEAALARAAEVRDPEVEQLGRIALAVHLTGVGDGAAAQRECEAALALSGPHADLAQLGLAAALLEQAFDDEDRIVDPSRLDAAASAYQKAVDQSSDPAVKGRGLAGLAGIAKYRKQTADVCKHAAAATAAYQTAGASDYLREVPGLLAAEAKCK
jgi:hypothetical protein